MKMKTFNVQGAFVKHDGQNSTGFELIRKYAGPGSIFILEREPDNPYDKNAIFVKQEFKKSGHCVVLGYVPKKLAAEFAPLMDQGWEPVVKFSAKFINEVKGEVDENGEIKVECRGMQLRYETR